MVVVYRFESKLKNCILLAKKKNTNTDFLSSLPNEAMNYEQNNNI